MLHERRTHGPRSLFASLWFDLFLKLNVLNEILDSFGVIDSIIGGKGVMIEAWKLGRPVCCSWKNRGRPGQKRGLDWITVRTASWRRR